MLAERLQKYGYTPEEVTKLGKEFYLQALLSSMRADTDFLTMSDSTDVYSPEPFFLSLHMRSNGIENFELSRGDFDGLQEDDVPERTIYAHDAAKDANFVDVVQKLGIDRCVLKFSHLHILMKKQHKVGSRGVLKKRQLNLALVQDRRFDIWKILIRWNKYKKLWDVMSRSAMNVGRYERVFAGTRILSL